MWEQISIKAFWEILRWTWRRGSRGRIGVETRKERGHLQDVSFFSGRARGDIVENTSFEGCYIAIGPSIPSRLPGLSAARQSAPPASRTGQQREKTLR